MSEATFSESIQKIRTTIGVRQVELARTAHISAPRLCLIETCSVIPRTDELERIRMALKSQIAERLRVLSSQLEILEPRTAA